MYNIGSSGREERFAQLLWLETYVELGIDTKVNRWCN